MANVLGELFQDIANAIRTKTGETNTMTPASFPDNILSIETGGGSGGGIVGKTGTFKPTSEGRITIEHGLGVMPSFVVVFSDSYTNSGAYTLFTYGISKALFDAAGGDTMFPAALMWITNGSCIPYPSTFESPRTLNGMIGANETTFSVGGSSYGKMETTATYTWIAFGGLA